MIGGPRMVCYTCAGMSLADLGLIGNCQLSALVRRDGAIVWCCMPRFDSAPVFGVAARRRDWRPVHDRPGRRRARACSATCRTPTCSRRASRHRDGAFRVLDFAPRFIQYERSFRPTKLVRIVEPLVGHAAHPRAAASRVLGWSQARPRRELGSHHIAFDGFRVRAAADHRRAAVVSRTASRSR